MDALTLARIQFGANISFHILFPTITIALGWVLLFFKLSYNRTQDQKWMDAYFFWVKVFALSFAMGVVSGITMSFQFGTNWPGFMEKVGNIAGPLLAYEVMTAFFLEAVFLGIMLFGFRKVSDRIHTLATFLVAFGTTMSAFWILALNSWMHTPSGFELRDGIAHAKDWFEIIFNPSFPYRLTHMLIASGLTASFLVAGISALRWLWGDRAPSVTAALKTGIYAAAILIPIQIVAGDLHGLNTLKHQPQKVAAMEANWETRGNVPLVLFGIPNEETHTNDYEISIPSLASIILKHDPDGVLLGLNDFQGQRPPVLPVFAAFRIMVGVGVLMLLVSWVGAWQMWRGGTISTWTARAFAAMAFSGWIATLAGWYVTEIGRQPWLVTGVLTTKQAASDVAAPLIGGTLAMYLIVYAVLIVAYMAALVHLARKAGSVRPDDPEIALQGKPVSALQPAE